jgi:flagellar protein FliO/FliZ
MPDLGDYTIYLIAGAVVLVVLIIILVILRSLRGGMGGRRGMRLGISEYYEIDKARRLILVRRDNVEHLVLIGGGQDVVIEPGISGRGSEPGMRKPRPDFVQPREFEPAPQREFSIATGEQTESFGADPQRPIAQRPAPRPAIFGENRPPNLRAVNRDEPRLGRRDGDVGENF